MKRVFALAFISVAVATTGFSSPASAYKAADSQWTDYDYLRWKRQPGFLLSVSDNTLDATSPDDSCNRMTWSGTTVVYAKRATATKLTDYWGASTTGDFAFTAPEGVVMTAPDSMSVTWDTTVSGNIQTHRFESVPITFTAGIRFNSITHIVSSEIVVGSRTYEGPATYGYERVC